MEAKSESEARATQSQGRIDDFERRARATGNLVYVWMAIFEAHAENLPMPRWCYGQIATWAGDIYELAHGLDPANGLEKNSNETDENFAERVHKRWARPEISPEEALKKARMVFGLSDRGWNAFRSIVMDEEALSATYISEVRKKFPKLLSSSTSSSEADARKNRRRKNAARKLLRHTLP